MNIIRTIHKLCFLGFVVFVTLAVIVLASMYDSNHYMAAVSDKHRRLSMVDSPRIILVGGSNLAFSVDSEKIEKHFEMPVVNMGLQAGLGLKFMLNEIQPELNSGDIVIIFPEYEHFYSLPLDGRPLELGAVAKFCSECVSVMTADQLFMSASGIFQLMENDILHFNNSENTYVRQGFNQWGDMVFHLDQTGQGELSNHILPIKIISPNPAVDTLNSFYKLAAENNIRVFLMFPAIPVPEYNAQEEGFSALYDLLQNELDIPIVGVPQDFAYPKKMFYDTVYHMNRIGRNNRTDHILELLTPLIQK